MATYYKYTYEELKKFCEDAFEKSGFTHREVAIITKGGLHAG